MARNQISFETLDAIIDQADLYFAEPGESDDDGVHVRLAYRGRGYRAEGFGLVIAPSALHVILVAAGMISKEQEGYDTGNTLSALDFARAVETDNMGRADIIAYWPDWEITDLPEHLFKD